MRWTSSQISFCHQKPPKDFFLLCCRKKEAHKKRRSNKKAKKRLLKSLWLDELFDVFMCINFHSLNWKLQGNNDWNAYKLCFKCPSNCEPQRGKLYEIMDANSKWSSFFRVLMHWRNCMQTWKKCISDSNSARFFRMSHRLARIYININGELN